MEDIAALAVSPAKGAALLGISRSKFYELLNEEIPAIKVGRRTLVRVADIQKFLDSLRAGGER
jgi:excisionase family DNA binding protein